jgi:hypothetical protein
MIVGALIVIFLIAEPHGLNQLVARDQGKTAALALSALGPGCPRPRPGSPAQPITTPWEDTKE